MITLIAGVVFGIICAFIGNRKGRSAVAWFFIGFLTGLIGLIILLCLSDLNEKESFKQRMRSENRRLRERVRQERMKNEAFQEHVRERLDVHDDQLGIDTSDAGNRSLENPDQKQRKITRRTPDAQGPEKQPDDRPASTRNRPGASQSANPADNASQWFYIDGDTERGPFPTSKMEQLVNQGDLSRQVMVRKENGDEWFPASDASELNVS